MNIRDYLKQAETRLFSRQQDAAREYDALVEEESFVLANMDRCDRSLQQAAQTIDALTLTKDYLRDRHKRILDAKLAREDEQFGLSNLRDEILKALAQDDEDDAKALLASMRDLVVRLQSDMDDLQGKLREAAETVDELRHDAKELAEDDEIESLTDEVRKLLGY